MGSSDLSDVAGSSLHNFLRGVGLERFGLMLGLGTVQRCTVAHCLSLFWASDWSNGAICRSDALWFLGSSVAVGSIDDGSCFDSAALCFNCPLKTLQIVLQRSDVGEVHVEVHLFEKVSLILDCSARSSAAHRIRMRSPYLAEVFKPRKRQF